MVLISTHWSFQSMCIILRSRQMLRWNNMIGQCSNRWAHAPAIIKIIKISARNEHQRDAGPPVWPHWDVNPVLAFVLIQRTAWQRYLWQSYGQLRAQYEVLACSLQHVSMLHLHKVNRILNGSIFLVHLLNKPTVKANFSCNVSIFSSFTSC